MNIKHIFTLAVMAGVFFNASNAAEINGKGLQAGGGDVRGGVVTLKTPADSLSYAAGVVRTDGLIPYLKQSLGVDTAYMADFIRGYRDAMAKGFGENDKAYYAGEQIAMMVSQRMLPFLKEEFAGKTDSVSEETLPGAVERYRSQVRIYGEALSRIYEMPIRKQYLYFFHLNRFAEV